jgi:serine/threonine-protein kinase
MSVRDARWSRASDIFHAAILLPESQRDAFIAAHCSNDATLLAEVSSLVAAHLPGSVVVPSVLAPGTRIGAYEIVEFIDAGGMGEVYRAKDTRLKRAVALKILPPAFADDPDRRARFHREAEVLASLNHPGIAQIFGLEEMEDVRALALEFVNGETLAERIRRGRIPIDETLRIAKQIAEALEAAHEQGIIHRDLKPGNIKLRPDGTVKLLDFGLAKLAETGVPIHADRLPAEPLSLSPTIVSPAMMTGVGVLLGTAAYMSPEQARGKVADRRSDIWAFGCVLFEMLTGKRPFDGVDVSDTIASILKTEPPWDLVSVKQGSSGIRYLLRRCLQKDPTRRLQAIGEARIAVEELMNGTPFESSDIAGLVPRRRRLRLAVAIAVASSAVFASAITRMMVQSAGTSGRVTRLQIVPSGAAAMSLGGTDRDVAITPDGSRVIYVGNRGTQLFIRPLQSLDAVALFSGAPRGPFPSPDGKWIGFFDGVVLRKVSTTGGPTVTLATVDSASRGAVWLPDDTIVFATQNPTTGLQRVPAAGGTPTVLTRPERGQGAVDHLWPEMLPGGHAVLFTVTTINSGTAGGDLSTARIAVLDLQTGNSTVVVRGGSDAHYASSGHLVYGADGTLFAVPFDVKTFTTHGTPVPIVRDVLATPNGGVDAALSSTGTLVYSRGVLPTTVPVGSPVWVDRNGQEQATGMPSRPYGVIRVSPDGTRAAVDIRNPASSDVWVWDFARSTLTRLTFEPETDDNPVWTPDGRRVVYRSFRKGVPQLFWTFADGTSTPERLPTSSVVIGNGPIPKGMAPDGQSVVIIETTPKGDQDLMQVFLDKDKHVQPLLTTAAAESNADVSPDGRWLAYQSDESGSLDVYVRPFRDVNGGRWQISSGGGSRPVWSHDGRELFYTSANNELMTVQVQTTPTFTAGRPAKLFDWHFVPGNGYRAYDVSPDGRRFLMIKQTASDDVSVTSPNIVVVENWLDELKRLVPAN